MLFISTFRMFFYLLRFNILSTFDNLCSKVSCGCCICTGDVAGAFFCIKPKLVAKFFKPEKVGCFCGSDCC